MRKGITKHIFKQSMGNLGHTGNVENIRRINRESFERFEMNFDNVYQEQFLEFNIF